MREFAIPDARVMITKLSVGYASVEHYGQVFAARFDSTRRGWHVGVRFSPSPKLHSIGKLFGVRRAAVAGQPVRELPPIVVLDDTAGVRQARRILASLDEFGFEPGGAWRRATGLDDFESGYQPRHGGDPIFHTIGRVAGVACSRADLMEAVEAVVEGRRPNLPPRMQTLPSAVVRVATALAEGKRVVKTVDGLTERIEGPMLPSNWDGQENAHV